MSSISVVVPVYKVEEYLKRCVDSILSQSFSDFDLILVDDGSPDACPAMCEDIAGHDERVVVIHQENGGLSAARNTGITWALQHSDSKWIAFIDSDDWIHPKYLEYLLAACEQNNLCISMCQIAFAPSNESTFCPVSREDISVLDTEEIFQMEEYDPNSAWGSLYQKKLFSEIRYPVGKLHEDHYTTYRLLFQFDKIGAVTKPMYCYFVNETGIVHSDWTPRKLDVLEASEQQMAYFRERGMQRMYAYTVREYVHLLVLALRNMKKHPEFRAQEKQVRRKLRRTLKKEHDLLGMSFRKEFNIYKYAYPFAAKVYGRIFMR